MKKLLALASFIGIALTLAACAGGSADTTAPVLTGVEDVTIFVGESFDPRAGVQAIDDKDGDISSEIRINGTFNTEVQGSYFLRYISEDAAGNRTEATRYVNVIIDPSLLGDALVPNGDFSLGWAVWNTTTGLENGNATYTVVDGELKVAISSVATARWEPRLENNGIPFEQGQIYKVSFEARADAPRAIQVQVGELLPSAPWFREFMGAVVFDLTTEMQTFVFYLEMELDDNDNGSLLFEMGTVPGAAGTANLITNVYLDNVEMTKVDALVDTIPPVISGIADTTIGLGEEFDPLAGVSVTDNVDGLIESSNVTVSGELDVDTLGEYTLTYRVSDAAGNEAVVIRVVSVVIDDPYADYIFQDTEELVDGNFTTTTTVPAEVQDTEENGYADITDSGFWYSYIADWDGAAATFSVVEGAMNIDITAVGGADWSVMLKQKGLSLVPGTVYQLSFTASASAARDITARVTNDYGRTFNITSTPQTYRFSFLYEGGELSNQLVIFLVGNTENYAAGTVIIDNVVFSAEDK